MANNFILPKNPRILCVGRSGSGKTHFSARLSKTLKIKLVHLDQLYFIENWQMKPKTQFLEEIDQILTDETSWIMDGNNLSSGGTKRFACANIVIFFDVPRWFSLYRIFKRLILRNLRIEKYNADRALNCMDTVSWELIKYNWHFDRDRKPRIEALIKENSQLEVVFIKTKDDFQAVEKLFHLI